MCTINEIVLSSLSDSELISRLEHLVKTERDTMQSICRHLCEVDSRRLYAKLAYSSLFDYATKGLGYTPAAAMRRIRAARVGKELPQVFDYLDRGEVTLASIEACSDAFHTAQAKSVLEELRGKSRSEAELIGAKFRKVEPSVLQDKVQVVVLGAGLDTAQGDLFACNPEPSGKDFRGELVSQVGEKKEACCESNSDRCVSEPESKYRISFAASAGFMKLLERAQELLFRGSKEDTKLENILGAALSCYLDKHDPQRRIERRIAHAEKAQKEVPEVSMNENALPVSQDTDLKPTSPQRKHTPLKLRDEVLARDGYQCSYVSSNGVRCGCRSDLEIDHIVPVAWGGEDSPGNLRALCRSHNALVETQAFGACFVAKKIDERRRMCAG
jgi:5-methylcytosine-specific restriction endonuclease McrA